MVVVIMGDVRAESIVKGEEGGRGVSWLPYSNLPSPPLTMAHCSRFLISQGSRTLTARGGGGSCTGHPRGSESTCLGDTKRTRSTTRHAMRTVSLGKDCFGISSPPYSPWRSAQGEWGGEALVFA